MSWFGISWCDNCEQNVDLEDNYEQTKVVCGHCGKEIGDING